ncbi:OLC1v1029198C1 [Oldenlandia corymbosa var. corymbosa]|uniref:OLC1v1029198C1 n=1 Tax=Oldenlandia corymbosa var. corymbosa TaxID=529605 RepID=A0AAV1CFC1_OLDCO|nr:OLC1v1029198C1 [Oldenlandia corymbosa var. corymbosa]
MGSCISTASSEIHSVHHGHENVAYYENSDYANDSQVRIGSIHSHQGSKGLNQDAAILYQGYGMEDGAFGGVFDGHGYNGHTVSKLVRNRLPSLLLNQMNAMVKFISSPKYNEKADGGDQAQFNKKFNKWKDAFLTSFKVMDKEIKLLENLDCSCSGTTAVVAVRQGEYLIVGNLGDSRAVLGTKSEDGIVPVQLTTDLKPGLPTEADRIRKCNGRVLALKEEPHIDRVWLPHDDSPGLAMSRAFGDFVLKNHGVIAIPEVSCHQLSENDLFLVLASDGVWDVLSNDQVTSIVSSTATEEAAAKAVVDASVAAWKQKFPNSKRDDCTVVCLFLKKQQPSILT